MKKKQLMLLTLALLMLVLTACGANEKGGNSGNNAANGDKKVSLRVLSTNPLVSEESMQLFMEQNSNIDITYEYVPSADYSAKFAALAASNEIPDVVWTQAGYYTDQIKQNLLLDLSEELKGQNYEQDAVWSETFVPALLENSRNTVQKALGEKDSYDYGVPFTMTTIAVLYDKNLYEQLGLQEPTTWEQFMSNNEALKTAGYTPLSMHSNWIDWYPRLFWDQYCRADLESNPNAFDEGTMTFSSECVQQGLTSFKELWDKGYLPESGITADLEAMQQMFVQGKLAQFLIAPDKLEYIMNNAPDTMSLATYALPGIAGIPSRSLGGSSNVFAVSATSKHPEEAILLLKFLTSKTHFTGLDALKYSNSGLVNLEVEPELAQFLSGFTNAAAGGFSPDMLVPTNINTEINTAFKTDLLPRFLLDRVDVNGLSEQLQTLYAQTK